MSENRYGGDSLFCIIYLTYFSVVVQRVRRLCFVQSANIFSLACVGSAIYVTVRSGMYIDNESRIPRGVLVACSSGCFPVLGNRFLCILLFFAFMVRKILVL